MTEKDPQSGLLVIDKSVGITSHDAVLRIRKILGLKKVGHTGTLDPFATGVLPVCLGKATKLVRFLSGSDKVYEGTIKAGFATDTYDREGKPLGEPSPVDFTDRELEVIVASLTGDLNQIPPMFSAKKVKGKPLYRLARRGVEIEREAKKVTVHYWKIKARRGDEIDFELSCSAGTYVRVLAHEIGSRLGCGSHLYGLKRTRSGDFGLESALRVDEVTSKETLLSKLIPLPMIRLPFGDIRVNEVDAERLRRGMKINAPEEVSGTEGDLFRILDEGGALAAIGRAEKASGADPCLKIQPRIVF
jgi:tRNA pseudouridine55 synthase